MLSKLIVIFFGFSNLYFFTAEKGESTLVLFNILFEKIKTIFIYSQEANVKTTRINSVCYLKS